jgi:hypothetical protein
MLVGTPVNLFIGCGFVLADDDMFTLWVASQSYPFCRVPFCMNIDFVFYLSFYLSTTI